MKHHHSVAITEPLVKSDAERATAVFEIRKAPVTHEMIAELAHSFWAERGYATGSPEQDWLRAEQQLLKSRTAIA